MRIFGPAYTFKVINSIFRKEIKIKINFDKNIELNNTQNNSPYNESPSAQVSLENNPLLPIVIILLSVILLVIFGGVGVYIYKRKKEGKVFANSKKKSDEKEEPDIESGEKKNRNSWTF